jgi:hypothetical protein
LLPRRGDDGGASPELRGSVRCSWRSRTTSPGGFSGDMPGERRRQLPVAIAGEPTTPHGIEIQIHPTRGGSVLSSPNRPFLSGLSTRNLKYMRAFAAAWPEPEVAQRPIAAKRAELAQQCTRDPYHLEIDGKEFFVDQRLRLRRRPRRKQGPAARAWRRRGERRSPRRPPRAAPVRARASAVRMPPHSRWLRPVRSSLAISYGSDRVITIMDSQ